MLKRSTFDSYDVTSYPQPGLWDPLPRLLLVQGREDEEREGICECGGASVFTHAPLLQRSHNPLCPSCAGEALRLFVSARGCVCVCV